MYNINRSYIFKNLYQDVYISSQLEPQEDANHNKIASYDTPVKYKRWNIQYVKSQSEILEFGQNVSNMRVAVIPNTPKYANKFKEFDLAYLDGASPYTYEEVNDETTTEPTNETNVEEPVSDNTNETPTSNTTTAEPISEVVNGQNANYRIYSVRPQNNIIRIYFIKLTK